MPRVNEGKAYQCPHCEASYKVLNSLYAHVKASHGCTYSSKGKVTKSTATISSNTSSNNNSIEDKLTGLKMSFLDGLITAEEFETKSKALKEKAELRSPKDKRARSLDIGKILDGTTEDTVAELTKYLEGCDINLDSLEVMLVSNKIATVFSEVYRGQLQYLDSDDGIELRYGSDGNENVIDLTVESNRRACIDKLYGAIIKYFGMKYLTITNKYIAERTASHMYDDMDLWLDAQKKGMQILGLNCGLQNVNNIYLGVSDALANMI